MKKLQVVLGVAAMFAFLYCIADLCGLSDYVSDAVNQRNGWTSVKTGSYSRTKIRSTHHWYISIMKDPAVEEFNLYFPPVKKEVLDRMTNIEEVTVEMDQNESMDSFRNRIKLLAQKKNGNVILVNITWTTWVTKSIETESLSLY